MTVRLIEPQSKEDWREARRLIEEYAAALNVDLCFQNFAHELEHLVDEYGPPGGTFLLAQGDDGAHVGCVGLRRLSEGVGEMKRLYAVPAVRGRGVGRLLAEGIIGAAKELGYARLLLDTLPAMQEAQGLYASLGFKPAPQYRVNPVAGSSFLGLDLRRA